MQVIETIKEMRAVTAKYRTEGKTIGFVPTMGALHEGHMSLVRAARAENDIVIASVFVNPTQFGPNEDYTRYPRTFDEDCELLEREGCGALFFPSPEEMYGMAGSLTWVSVDQLPEHLCGLHRPDHFQGVTTVVAKFFNIVDPHRAYFGQKDYQQSVIIRRMTADLNFPVEIRVMPIVRESDGLALSSRNRYLSADERLKALALVDSLRLAEQLYSQGEKNPAVLTDMMQRSILGGAPNAKIEYIAVVHPDTLEPLKTIKGTAVIALAVVIGTTRLIDNVIIE
jgi:pantoate--beta-alanine ligase